MGVSNRKNQRSDIKPQYNIESQKHNVSKSDTGQDKSPPSIQAPLSVPKTITDNRTESKSDAGSDSNTSSFDSAITMCELMVYLQKDKNLARNMDLLKAKMMDMTVTDIVDTWTDYGNIILKNIASSPASCISYQLHLLDYENRSHFMQRLGILTYKHNKDDSLILLNGNTKVASILIKKNNVGQSIFVDKADDQTKILSYAYKCMNMCEWGLAHLLFKKAGHDKGASEVLNQYCPTYIKLLFGIV